MTSSPICAAATTCSAATCCGSSSRITRRGGGVSPTTRQKEYFGSKFRPAFAVFRAQRAELLEVLEPLPLEAWERTATVTGMVRDVYENSVLYYGDWMARHERSHLRHIKRILAEIATR